MTRRLLNCQRLLGMVVAMLCLLGIAAYSTMPRQEDPSFPYRAGLISINYPGASADAVERLVLRLARVAQRWSRFLCREAFSG